MSDVGKQGLKRKRKREAHTNPEDVSSRLNAKLHHGLKEVKKASKKVKTFETQKVVKKLKEASKDGDEGNSKQLESQLECLKHIDYDDIAARSLRSKIKKHALLSRREDCLKAVSSELPVSPANHMDNSPVRSLVESRLLSSKVLSSEVANVISSLEHVLGVGNHGTPAEDLGNINDREDEYEMSGAENAIISIETPPSKPKARTARDSVTRVEKDEGSSHDDAAWTGFNDELDDDSIKTNDDEEVWVSASSLSENQDDRSHESDGSQSSSLLRSSSRKKVQLNATSLQKETKAKAGESTFLPSLDVGFISGSSSDSEWSDAEAAVADLPAKKNRRGQRARKAIWEKKYGRNANHIRKQRENDVSVAVRDAYGHRGGHGRGALRGGGVVRDRGRPIAEEIHGNFPHSDVLSSGRGRGRGRDRGEPHTGRPSQGEIDAKKPLLNMRPNVRDAGDDKPLHPSWEAKRRLKEKQNPSIVPTMGTKIKFT